MVGRKRKEQENWKDKISCDGFLVGIEATRIQNYTLILLNIC